jgi:hypothetical protein
MYHICITCVQACEFGKEVVGRRIAILWPKEMMFFSGTVTEFHTDGIGAYRHKIVYDDSDDELVALIMQDFVWLSPRSTKEDPWIDLPDHFHTIMSLTATSHNAFNWLHDSRLHAMLEARYDVRVTVGQNPTLSNSAVRKAPAGARVDLASFPRNVQNIWCSKYNDLKVELCNGRRVFGMNQPGDDEH